LWGKIEPNDVNKQCINILTYKNKADKGDRNLNDGNCSHKLKFICEGQPPINEAELNKWKQRFTDTENAKIRNNKLYHSFSTKRNRADALDFCKSWGLTLAKVDDPSLITWFQASDGLNNKADEWYWVGGNEIRNFAWNDDTPVDDSVWHDNKPNRSDEKCVEAFDDGSRVGLNDVKCSGESKKAFICERRC